MRALLNLIARDKKIIVSLVFAFVLIGAAAVSQGFWGDSKVFGAEETTRTGGGKGGDEKGGGKGGDTGELCGFAWGATTEPVVSKMGVGWVSFNSKDCDANGDGVINGDDSKAGALCPEGETSDYGVSVDGDQNLVGYAWSSNLGWLKFGGLTDFPESGGKGQENARINGDGTVDGWARFCAGTADGECASMEARSDGWDGWVSLRGSSPEYGVSVSGDNFSGYSWGDEVVGWLNWSAGTGNNVRYCDGAPADGLVATLVAEPTSGEVTFRPRLTATYELTGSDNGGTPSYKFKCDYSGDWSESQSSNVYENCSYSSTGYHHPQVEVTLGSLVAVDDVEVQAKGDNDGDPDGDLGAVCTVSRPAFVGFPVTWTVTLDEETPPGEYTYTLTFSDDLNNPVVRVSENLVERVIKTYSAPGAQSVDVTVEGTGGPTMTATCNTSTNVTIRPTIIPI